MAYTGCYNDADDYYSILVTKNVNVTVNLNSTYVEAGSHFQMQLMDEQGGMIDYRIDPVTSTTRSLAPGTYFLRIFTDPSYTNPGYSHHRTLF